VGVIDSQVIKDNQGEQFLRGGGKNNSKGRMSVIGLEPLKKKERRDHEIKRQEEEGIIR